VQPADKRKSQRRTIKYPAWIALGDGSAPMECSLCNASQHGAQLTVADPYTVPDEFTLALSSDGAATRRCRVAWRTGDQIGVEFLLRPKKKPGEAAAPSNARPTANVAGQPAEETHSHSVDVETLAPR